MSPADPSPRLPARPPASPAAVAEAFEAAWNAADADALADLFAEDADFVTVLGVWWTRRRQIRLDHARGFRWMFPESRLEMGEVRVRDLGDVAVVHAPWTMTGPGVGGADNDDGAARGQSSRQRSSGSSTPTIRLPIAASCFTCARVSGSRTTRRTSSTWPGADSSTTARPSGVSTARV